MKDKTLKMSINLMSASLINYFLTNNNNNINLFHA